MANFFDNKARAAASSSKSKAAEPVVAAPRMQPWVEKYRPKNLQEVRAQDHNVEILKRMVNASNLPHLLMYGPPGTGKTSTILALCRELFPPTLFASRVLELNASDERGISVIREKVKQFAATHLTNPTKEDRERYPCPPFKVIILDEADSLTQDAQGALRRVMEIHAKITRFCLCCNYVSRIIDPVASRCSKFRFKSLEGGQAQERIAEILKAEHVSYDDGVIERSLKVSDGDLRRAINLLQSAARLAGATGATASNGTKATKTISDDEDEEMADAEPAPKPKTHSIKVADIDEISGTFPPELTDKLYKVLQKGSSANFSNVQREVKDIVASGYSANEVLLSLYTRVVNDELVGDQKIKYRILQVLSEMDRRLVDGVDEEITLLDLCLQLAGDLVK